MNANIALLYITAESTRFYFTFKLPAMLYKVNLSLVFVIISMLSFTTKFSVSKDQIPAKKIIGWSVQKTSNIKIQGSTNVNSFGCDIINYTQPDTIFCTSENAGNQPVTLTGNLKVAVSKFDCHNKMMTRDLQQTLKTDEYPILVIRFLSLERTPEINNTKDCLKGWVEIELAGCSKRFEINYSFVATGSSLIQLNGNRSFNFSDFKLTPPKKFAGLVKVKDELVVDFNLLLDPLE